jgi:methyl-accepting chemotaxis protein
MLRKIGLSKKIIYLVSVILILQIVILSIYNYNAQQDIINSFKTNGDIEDTQLNNILLVSIVISLIVIVFGILLSYFLSKKIATPIQKIASILQKMSKGEETHFDIEYQQEDEIKQVTQAAYQMFQNQKQYLEFAKAIANGDFTKTISAEGALKESLLTMGSNLQATKEADRRRDWVNSGLAKFAKLLRETNMDDLQLFYSAVLAEIVKYLKYNQGALFLLENSDEDKKNWFFEMKAAYAYERSKYLEKIIPYGNGAISEAVLQKESIYLTEIPSDYIKITSGLGESLPNFTFICPLVYKEEVVGVIELADFGKMEDYQKQYVLQISESIASVLISNKINAKTLALLQESEKNAAILKEKEEMMVNNLAEMQENERKMREGEEKMQQLLQNLKENEQVMARNLEEMQENELKMKENEEKTQELLQHLMEKEKEMEKKWMVHESELNVVMEEISGNLELAQKNERIFKKANEFYDLSLSKLKVLFLIYKQDDLTLEFVSTNIEDEIGYLSDDFKEGKLLWDNIIDTNQKETICVKRAELIQKVVEDKFTENIQYDILHVNGEKLKVSEKFRLMSPKKGRKKYILSYIEIV